MSRHSLRRRRMELQLHFLAAKTRKNRKTASPFRRQLVLRSLWRRTDPACPVSLFQPLENQLQFLTANHANQREKMQPFQPLEDSLPFFPDIGNSLATKNTKIHKNNDLGGLTLSVELPFHLFPTIGIGFLISTNAKHPLLEHSLQF